MKLEEMVEELNEYVNRNLTITSNRYGSWEISSYDAYSLFEDFEDKVEASTIREVVEKAYKKMQEDKKIKEV